MPNGNIIDTVGIDVNQLDVFDISNFEVNISNGHFAGNPDITTIAYQYYTDITATLLNGYSWYYDIDCKVVLADTGLNNFHVAYNNVSDWTSYFDFVSGDFLRIYRGSSDFIGDVFYRITNKETGQVVHIKKINLVGSVTGTTVGNVIYYDNQSDFDNDNGVIDSSGVVDNSSSNYSSWGLGYSEVSWSDIRGMISTSGDFWQCVRLILSCVPTWITAPIFFFVSAVVTIVLTKMLVSAVTSIMG